MSPLPKIELRLNEENELSFKMEIQGSTSDASGTKTKYRFTITEFGTDKGWVYPVIKEKNNIVKVNIPALKETFSSNKKYFGKLEVIMGNLYFTPTELMVSFKEPLKVKAAAVIATPKISSNEEHSSETDEQEETEEDIEDSELNGNADENDNSSEEINDEIEEEEQEEESASINTTFRPPLSKEKQNTQSSEEEKIDLDSYFIDNSAILPASSKNSSSSKLNPDLIQSISKTLFSIPNEKETLKNNVVSAMGFDENGPSEIVKKSFTASGIPEKESSTSQKDFNFSLPDTHITKTELSLEAIKLKENFKKAFREALSFNEQNTVQPSIPIQQPVKKQTTNNQQKTNNFLEEAKKLLMAQQTKKNNKKPNKKTRSLKDLFDN